MRTSTRLAAVAGIGAAAIALNGFGAEHPEESTLCIEADGAVTYEAPQGIWESHLTLGDESANQIVLDPAEGDDAEGYLVDLSYDADQETIDLVESGDDGRWFTYVRA